MWFFLTRARAETLEGSNPIELEFRQTDGSHSQTRGHSYTGRTRSAAQSPQELGLRADAVSEPEPTSASEYGALSPIRLVKSRGVADTGKYQLKAESKAVGNRANQWFQFHRAYNWWWVADE
jgi:hypothetical protein